MSTPTEQTYDIPVTMHVTEEDIIDIVEGAGALDFEWWLLCTRMHYGTHDEVWEWLIEARDPNDDDARITVDVTRSDVAKALTTYLAEHPVIRARIASRTNIFERMDVGQIDAYDADNILQTIVYGEIVYG